MDSSSYADRIVLRVPSEVAIAEDVSPSDLYLQLATLSSYSVHRLCLTTEDGLVLSYDDKIPFSDRAVHEGTIIHVKDLGPQLRTRTVCVIEYLGPIIIHIATYIPRPHIYKHANTPPSTLQTLSLITIILHFTKRELETLFLHRFSKPTMPAFNIVRNSAHYWLLAGALISYSTYAPDSVAAGPTNLALVSTGLLLFAIGEIGNLKTHLILRSLRKPGSTERKVPTGFGFDLVTCPNYLFEIVAWVGILLINWSWTTLLFIGVSAVQMGIWAKEKEVRYREEFGGKYPRKRFAMLPGIW